MGNFNSRIEGSISTQKLTRAERFYFGCPKCVTTSTTTPSSERNRPSRRARTGKRAGSWRDRRYAEVVFGECAMATTREETIPLRGGEAADRVTGSGVHRVFSYQGGDPVLSGPSLDPSHHDVSERRRVIRGIMRSACAAGTMVRPPPPPSRHPPSAPRDPRLPVARRSTRLSATSDARHSDARPTRAHPLTRSPPPSRPRPPRRSS